MTLLQISAGKSQSVKILSGDCFRIINSEGGQVVDTWAFNANDYNEYLSMSHSRSALYKLQFQPGDTLVSNIFSPIILILDDTSPGCHDTLHAACSPGSYEFYGLEKRHPNCQDNLKFEMTERHHELASIPDPWNLFEHTLIDKNSVLKDAPSRSKPGNFIALRAEMDLLLVCSACPSTVGSISGDHPKGAKIQIL